MRAAITILLLAQLVPSILHATQRVTTWGVVSDASSLQAIQMRAGLHDEINPVWFKVNADGTLLARAGVDSAAWRAAISGVSVVPTIQNGTTKDSDMQMQTILASRELRERHVDEIVATRTPSITRTPSVSAARSTPCARGVLQGSRTGGRVVKILRCGAQ